MIVVNFGTSQYAAGQQRLIESLGSHKHVIYTKYSHIGSPTHQQSSYEFKLHAINKAFEKDDIVLWCDSSMWLVGDLSKIEKIIKEDGYFFEEAGHYCTKWCNDRARDYFKLPADSPYLMFSAGLVGLNLKSETAMEFFYRWKQSAKAGCFRGDWSNHRHDMTCGSIIAQSMGMKYQSGGSFLSYIGEGYTPPLPGSVFYCQGL